MQIYILRHGIAEEGRPGKPDAARKLTEAGKRKLARVLERARGAGVSPGLILSSPLERALGTARLAADALGYSGKVAETEALSPDSTPQRLWQEIGKHQGDGD